MLNKLLIVLMFFGISLKAQKKFHPTFSPNFYQSVFWEFIELEEIDSSKIIIALYNENTLSGEAYWRDERFIECHKAEFLIKKVENFSNKLFVSVGPLVFNQDGRLECRALMYKAEIIPNSEGVLSFVIIASRDFYFKNFSHEWLYTD